MLGAIIGDVIGSIYERNGIKKKQFPLFRTGCRPTDDSLMTIAVGCACVSADLHDEASFKYHVCKFMREIGCRYPDAGYGKNFYWWLHNDRAEAYGSLANGSAMRVSPSAWAAGSLTEAERLARWSAEVTHNHPEGIEGACAVASAIYLARTGADKPTIRAYIQDHYYDLNFTIEEIRPTYRFDVTCRGSVPQAIVAFLDAHDFEDAIRNAVSLGGDGDTQASIAGAIAEAYWGIPDDLQETVFAYMDEEITDYYRYYADVLYG